ncbi:MAG: SIS domain-containing protein [Bacteroidales bacterium]|nr:SIS domain-containing protein [Bacteroidales bacterium]
MTKLDNLIERYPALEVCREAIWDAYKMLEALYEAHGKLLVAGNGGSAADAEHIVGEMMKKGFVRKDISPEYAEALRKADPELGAVLAEELEGSLMAIALDGHISLTTAYMNDREPLLCFAQQVSGYGRPGDVLLAISTSGNSKNVLYAAVAARARGMKVIGLTGANACKLDAFADVCIKVPETETYKIQELHLPVYHCLCWLLEERFFG